MELLISAKCIICKGTLVERSHMPYEAAVDASLYGSGSRNVYDGPPIIDGYHCDTCGLEYHKLPAFEKA